MERPGFARNAKLPGFDAFTSFVDASVEEHTLVGGDSFEAFIRDPHHSQYLKNTAFHHYIGMQKGMIDVSEVPELLQVADQLEQETLPTYLDAAAWAHAELGLADTTSSAADRMEHIIQAEELWGQAARTELQLQSGEHAELFYDTASAYRLALPLAYTPLMKSIIVGNVTDDIRKQALADTVAFSSAVSRDIKWYESQEDGISKSYLVGLAHELNALSTLLLMDDPRYVPLPSTARADTGYYHPEQTHDIMLLNQHWGVIRKVIPIEVKSRPSRKARNRYKALILRGRMHLSLDRINPVETAEAFERMLSGEGSMQDVASLERISTDIREMLRLYQTGYTPEALAINSLTRFQKSTQLERAHPEIAP